MDDENHASQPRGPVMIAATRIINPPPARIGQIGPNFTLPRTVPVKAVVAGAVGAVVGVLVGALFGSAQALIIAMIVGAAVGVAAVSLEPAKGENVLQWVMTSVLGRARQRKVNVGGKQLAVYVGIARITRVAAGKVRIVPSAVEIDPASYDERGVLRTAHNKNLSETGPRSLREQNRRFAASHDLSLPDAYRDTIGSRATTHTREVPVTPAPMPKPLQRADRQHRLGARKPDTTTPTQSAPPVRPLLDMPNVPPTPRTGPRRLGAQRPSDPQQGPGN